MFLWEAVKQRAKYDAFLKMHTYLGWLIMQEFSRMLNKGSVWERMYLMLTELIAGGNY